MSLLIDADGEKLFGQFASPLWTVATKFTIAAQVKILGTGWGEIFGLFDTANPTYNNATLRTAAGTSYDHNLVLKGADKRMDGSGSVSGGWDLLVLTYEEGVAKIAYRNTSAARTDLTNVAEAWEWGVGADGIAFGGLVGRMKIAHAAAWFDVAFTAGDVADLKSGGAGGAGKDPTTIHSANLKFYRPLINDAAGGIGTIAFNAIGSPTFDAADNPNVESAGSGGGTLNAVASGSAAASGTANAQTSGASGTFTSEPLTDLATNVLANQALNFYALYNDTTGVLVTRKTGLSTDASGIVSFTDPAVVTGQFYRSDWETTDGKRRMPRKAAT